MSNPIFTKAINNANGSSSAITTPMTITGTINKTFLAFILLVLGSCIEWELFTKNYSTLAMNLIYISSFIGFILALCICFVNKGRSVLVPIYSFLEGLVLGGITIPLNSFYPGIATQAVLSTFGVFAVVLFLYKTKLIQATEKFRKVVIVATASICIVYFINLILSFFHLRLTALFASGSIGIGFSVFVVIIAALNFIIDFDNIEYGQRMMLDKSYEWYFAFGLMVTFVWLYIEILNLLSKLRSRN